MREHWVEQVSFEDLSVGDLIVVPGVYSDQPARVSWLDFRRGGWALCTEESTGMLMDNTRVYRYLGPNKRHQCPDCNNGYRTDFFELDHLGENTVATQICDAGLLACDHHSCYRLPADGVELDRVRAELAEHGDRCGESDQASALDHVHCRGWETGANEEGDYWSCHTHRLYHQTV